jgi:hypothetical protein
MAKVKDQSKKVIKTTITKKIQVNDSKPIIPEKYQTPVYLVLVLLLIIIFFKSGLFDGKVFSSADNIASSSFATFLNDAKAKGEFPLWVPYIFGGMPSFAALVPHLERMYDISHAVWVTFRDALYSVSGNNSVFSIVLFYIIFAFSFYFLALHKFKDKLIALYCAIASVFITPIIQLIIIGHNSKMIAIMMFPAVFLFIEKIYDYFLNIKQPESKKNIYKVLLYFAFLVFFIHVQMSSNHIQMLFYMYFLTGLYLLYKLVFSIIKKNNLDVTIKTIGIFIIAVLLSAIMYADSYLSIKEYNKYSIRGVSTITNQLPDSKSTVKNNSEPLDYDYATSWSFSPTEVMTFFIPYWVGFGDVEYKGQKVNTYWGQMPFNTHPMYFGVLTLLLAIIGITYNFRKNPLVQSLTIISILALIISFGRTLPVLFDLMFYNFPYFSSFRAPVMIHIIINLSFVILAGFGIKSILELVKDKIKSEKFIKAGRYVFPILALPILISIIGFEGYYSSQVANSPLIQKLQQQGAKAQQISQYTQQVATIAYDNVKSEMMLISIILLAGYAACYFYLKGKIKYQFFLAGLILLTLIDLWHIDFKTLHWDNKTDNEGVFKTPDYVDWVLKNEKSTDEFRVLELNQGSPQRSNTPAYWRLHSMYGYQGAKLRIYQDMDDVAQLTNPFVINLMNTKYIFTDQPMADSNYQQVYKGTKLIYLNKTALPKAYFVSEFKTASGLEILTNIRDGKFDPKKTAFLEKDPGVKIDAADSTLKVNVTGFSIHNISLDAEALGNNLLVLGEVYYPAGWKAYIDGNETEIFKTNYLFRSIIVPKGKHKIEFKFYPETYYKGKSLAIGGNILLILVFIVGAGGIIIQKKKNNNLSN